MERIQLSEETMGECVEHAAHVLSGGGVIVYPTDTLYGLGADAFSDAAVDMIYEIKGRDEKKPMHCVVAGIAMAEEYAELTPDARLLLERLTPGPLTVVVRKRAGWGSGIARGIDTIGIRIPQNDFCLALARAFGKPFTATSANRAGEAPRRTIDAILGQLRNPYASLLQKTSIEDLDLVIDAGQLLPSRPSTVVDMSGEEPVTLREGAIPVSDVWNAIRAEA